MRPFRECTCLFLHASRISLRMARAQVDSQDGPLDCEVLTGTARYEHPAEVTGVTFHLMTHENAPFGVAAVKMNLDTDNGYTGKIDIRMLDSGTEAQSELPDVK